MSKEANVFNLNLPHKNLLTNYITFIKSKEGKCIKEISSGVDDFTKDK